MMLYMPAFVGALAAGFGGLSLPHRLRQTGTHRGISLLLHREELIL